ncbi:hypothetical protein Peur_028277 [Populus x canadensis]
MNITSNIEPISEPTTVGGSRSPIFRGRRENVSLDIFLKVTRRAKDNIKRMCTSQWPYVVSGVVTPTLVTMSPSLTPYLVARVNRAFAEGSTPQVTPQAFKAEVVALKPKPTTTKARARASRKECARLKA